MEINLGFERKKFTVLQQKLRKEYEAAGMTEEQIVALYEYDLHEYNRNIAYYRHTQQLTIFEGSDMEEGQNPLLYRYSEQLSVYQEPSLSGELWWLDEIEDEELVRNLKQLTDEELDLISKLAFGGYSQKDIANEKHKSQAAVSQNISTIRKKLKKSE